MKLPIISRREIQTKVAVRSGETVVMGGLETGVKLSNLLFTTQAGTGSNNR